MKNRIRMVTPDGGIISMVNPWIGLLSSQLHNKIEDAVHILNEDNDPIAIDFDAVDSILNNTEFLEQIDFLVRYGAWDSIKEVRDGQKN